MVSVSVRYFFYKPMDEKIKTGTLRFPAKENPNKEKALFDWPIELQYDVKGKYRLTSRKFSGMNFFSPERSLNQPKATRVCIRSINQSNRSISVRLFFLFCSRVFISRSYKNRSITFKLFHYHDEKVNFIFPQSAKELSRTPLSVLHLNLKVLYVGLLDRWIKFWSETIQMNATDW